MDQDKVTQGKKVQRIWYEVFGPAVVRPQKYRAINERIRWFPECGARGGDANVEVSRQNWRLFDGVVESVVFVLSLSHCVGVYNDKEPVQRQGVLIPSDNGPSNRQTNSNLNCSMFCSVPYFVLQRRQGAGRKGLFYILCQGRVNNIKSVVRRTITTYSVDLVPDCIEKIPAPDSKQTYQPLDLNLISNHPKHGLPYSCLTPPPFLR